MSYLDTTCPHCGKVHRVDVFGSGGGELVARALTLSGQHTVPLLAQIPIDLKLRTGGDDGKPIVLSDPEQPASQVILSLADRLIEARQAALDVMNSEN
jgi:ATP-binding protein involved in chromosome partitioning